MLGTVGRGNAMEISTYVKATLDSEMSGNVVDLCPVGALTSKPNAFAARAWEYRTTHSIDVLDGCAPSIQVGEPEAEAEPEPEPEPKPRESRCSSAKHAPPPRLTPHAHRDDPVALPLAVALTLTLPLAPSLASDRHGQGRGDAGAAAHERRRQRGVDLGQDPLRRGRP